MPAVWLWNIGTPRICSMQCIPPKSFTIQDSQSCTWLLMDLLEKEWTSKSCQFPHTRGNQQLVNGFFLFFWTTVQCHKGRQIKDRTPDYSLHPPHDHLEIPVLDPPVKAGHQNNTPVTLVPWDAVQKTQHMPKNDVQSPGNSRQPLINTLLSVPL